MRNIVRPFAATVIATAALATFANGPVVAQSQTAMAAQIEVLSPLAAALRETIQSDPSMDAGIAEFYAKRSYLPVWINADERRAALENAVNGADDHGLAPASYAFDAANTVLVSSYANEDKAMAEVMFAKIFVDLARDLNTGVLEPRKVYNANFIRPDVKPAGILLRRAASSDLAAYLDELAPSTPEYVALQAEKQRLDAIIANGDFGAAIPTNRLLRPGYAGDRTILVRNRLGALGYGELGDSSVYDEELVAIVKIDPKDVGHVREGSNVVVKVTTFDARRYGEVPGRIEVISPTSIAPDREPAFYKAVLSLERDTVSNGAEVKTLRAGMTLSAEIETATRSVLSYLLKPVRNVFNNSLTER